MLTISRPTESRKALSGHSYRGRARRPVRFAVVVVLVGLLLSSCGRPDVASLDRELILIGMDGLEWDVMGPLVESGRLPNFARIIDEGTWGELDSLDIPDLESPIIWTSIATGKAPEKHGIWGFLKVGGRADPATPMTSNSRRVKALWNILGDAGRNVGVIDWLVTWPAEEVRGYVVTSYFAFPKTPDRLRDTAGMVYPEALYDEIEHFRYVRGELDDATVLEYVNGGKPADPSLAKTFDVLKVCLELDETTRATADYLFRERPTDFSTVYFRGVDGPCHRFWTALFPESGPPISEEEASAFRDVIPRYYEYMDRVLGELLELANENTTVMVVSDHGHSGPKLRGDRLAWGTAMHDPTGVMVLWGRDIAAGRELDSASVLDVAPTVLALYGMPVANDMDGKVLTEAMTPGFLEAHPIRQIDTYEDPGADDRAESREPIESPMDDAVKDRLRSLGYIE